jgi:hypothetical protein
VRVKVDDAIDEWHRSQPPLMAPPEIVHHPVDPELQTGDSALLGGAMEIKSPWSRDN